MKKTTTSSPSISSKRGKNREFAVVMYLFLTIFLLMMGYFVYFQLFRSEDVINSPYNKRQNTFAEHVVRGSVLAEDGTVLAQTIVNEDGSETRYYPFGSMFAHAVGYDVNGKSGIESFANFNLLRSHAFFLEQVVNGLQGQKNPGDNVVTTLNYKLQETAYNALGSSDGAVIVTEPATGKILAMVSKPDFNPNTIGQDWDWIVSDDSNSMLLNRVTQGLYPPGSTFKIFTTLQYLRENPNYESYWYECNGSITEGDFKINCAKNIAHGPENLMDAFAKSCNAAYAGIGLQLSKNGFSQLCDELLFHTDLPTAYPFKQSSFALSESTEKEKVMQTAIGQGETLMTPMHLNLITAAIANDGVLMKPYVVDHTENYKGITVKEYKASLYDTILSKEESQILQQFMTQVVTNGTGSALNGGNYTAAGKTGSAEYSNDKSESHAWFTGYAENETIGEIAVTVIVEGGGSGSDRAVPVARAIFDAYFNP